jgi:hypothetical protein
MSGFIAKVISKDELSREDIGSMYELMRKYYHNMKTDKFLSDLEEKKWVLLIRGQNQEIQGFTTITLFQGRNNQEIVHGVYSGDTVVDKKCRGSGVLQLTWLRFVLSLSEKLVPERLFWLLISKGYKTYRFLPSYFKRFYPSVDESATDELKNILDGFAGEKFGDQYDPKSGLITLRGESDYIKEREIEPDKLKDPYIRFFLEKNPYYYRGVELACLTELSISNLTEFGGLLVQDEIKL